jgi:hypothetical protein
LIGLRICENKNSFAGISTASAIPFDCTGRPYDINGAKFGLGDARNLHPGSSDTGNEVISYDWQLKITGDGSMPEIVFQVVLLAGVWLVVVLLNAVRRCLETWRDTIDQPNVDELREALQSIDNRVEALANDYRKIHPALRSADDEIY